MAFSPGKATTKNLFWAYLSFGFTKVLNFTAIVIVTRYVDPSEFGLMAICLAVMGYFDIVSRFGLGAALISERDDPEDAANAVFICSLATSSVMAIVMWQCAEMIAGAFNAASLSPLLKAISVTLIIRAISAVHFSFLMKELGLRKKIIPDISQGLAKGVISIGMAVSGYGVWSLIAGYIAGTVVSTIILLAIRPWRPTAFPNIRTIRHVMSYGLYLIGAETINATSRLLDNLLVGKFIGTGALGVYALSFRIPELAIKTLTAVSGTVLHPVMSKIQSNPDEISRYFYQSLGYCALLVFGVGSSIAVLATPIVHVLYTEEWYGMINPMRFITLGFAVSTINMVPGILLKTMGRTDLMFRVSLITLPFIVFFLAAAIPLGITAVAAAQFLLSFVPFWPTYLATKRVMDISLDKVFSALRPALVCSSAATLATALTIHSQGGIELIRLLSGIATYTLVFLIALRFQMPEAFMIGAEYILKRRRA